MVKRKLIEAEDKLGGVELKLAEAANLNLAQADEKANLRVALEACKNKWYNEGFADAENSVKLVICEAQKPKFKEGWLATLQALRLPEDSPLRNPNQIPFLNPTPSAQNPFDNIDEEETPSMRELV